MSEQNEQIIAQTPTPQVRFDDGDWIFRLRHEDMEKGERETKGKPNGIHFAKFAYSQTQTQLEQGGGFEIVDENGNVRTAKKFSIVFETVDGGQIAAKRDAKFFRGIVASLKKRTGLTKTKQPVAESNKLALADLRQWADGKRQIDGYDFEALPELTQEKVYEVMDKLGNPAAKTSKPSSGIKHLMELWDTGLYDFMLEKGKITQAQYDEAKATVERQRKLIEAQKVKTTNEPEISTEPIGADEV